MPSDRASERTAPRVGPARQDGDSSTSDLKKQIASSYRSELAVAEHELHTLPAGREVFVRRGNVFLLADSAAAQAYLKERQKRTNAIQDSQKLTLKQRT